MATSSRSWGWGGDRGGWRGCLLSATMGPAAGDNEQMEQLRELIKVLLGVSCLKEDLNAIVSDLVKLCNQLEVHCPALTCHFHVSGVSRKTGESFFVIVYDAALMASGEAKRVIKTLYTHLQGEASMVMTSALFRNSLVRHNRPPPSGGARPVAKLAAPPAADKDESMVERSTTGAALHDRLGGYGATGDAMAAAPLGAANGGAPKPGAASQPSAAATPSIDGDQQLRDVSRLVHGHDAHDYVPPGDKGKHEEANNWDEDGHLIPAVDSPPPSPSTFNVVEASGFAAVGIGFTPPAVHVPSAEANDAMEDLFTAVKGGWVGLLRATLSAVLLALVAYGGLRSKAVLQGMLTWWPVVLNSRNLEEGQDALTSRRGRRGRVGDRLAPHPFPVEVQRRHVPTGERRRDTGNVVDIDVVTLDEVAPAGTLLIKEVVATLLLLFDKENAIVAAVMEKKLAERGCTRKERKEEVKLDTLASLTVDDVLARRGFGGAPRAAPPDPPSTVPSDACGATSQQETAAGTSQAVSDAVVARLAARQAAGVTSQRALAACQSAESSKKAERSAARNLKRSGAAASTATAKKRPRLDSELVSRSEALGSEFKAPKLRPSTDVQSCSVLTEASMLADHTYHSLATNWPPLETNAHAPSFEVETASGEEWAAIVEQQKQLMVVLEEATVRRARRALLEKADEVRGDKIVDPQFECRLFVKTAARGNAGELKLTSATLQAMTDLHAASIRVQVFRSAVEWLRDAAGYTSSRVPDFSGLGHASNGALANEIVAAFEASHPTKTLWRRASPAAVGGEEDVVVPAYLLVKNTQDVCMTDDIITVNSIIVARWCAANRPGFWVLHCSFFVELLSIEEAGIAGMAAVVHAAAAGVTELYGVCNISNAHWVTVGVEMRSKTVWLYDSGAHFQDLQKDIKVAMNRMQLFGKCMLELTEQDKDAAEAAACAAAARVAKVSKTADAQQTANALGVPAKEGNTLEGGGPSTAASAAKSAKNAEGTDGCVGSCAADGDGMATRVDLAKVFDSGKKIDWAKGGDSAKGSDKARDVAAASGNTTATSKDTSAGAAATGVKAAAAKAVDETTGTAVTTAVVGRKDQAIKKPKSWTSRKVKVPAQADSTSCGPFAFAFLWHKAHDCKSRVLQCDAFALRMSMIAGVVRDGEEQQRQAALLEGVA